MGEALTTKRSKSWSIARDEESGRPGGGERVRVRRRVIESDLAMLARSMAISLAFGSFGFFAGGSVILICFYLFIFKFYDRDFTYR